MRKNVSIICLISAIMLLLAFSSGKGNAQTAGPLVVSKITIDDDEDAWADDHSEGDGDKTAEQGEKIRMDIFLKNNGTATATGVTATISTTSNWVTITNATRSYDDIDAGKEESSAGIWRDGFHFTVDNNAPSGDVLFTVEITTGNAGSHTDSVVVSIKGGGISGPVKFVSFEIDDDDNSWADDESKGDGDGVPEQGEVIRMPVTITNEGTAPAFDVKATLSATSNNVKITKATADYQVVGDGDSEDNEGMWRDGFHFEVASDADSEDVVFKLEISTRNSGTFVDSFTVSVVGGGVVGPVEIVRFEIDDDDNRWADDHSSGNGDGIINEDETIRLGVTLANRGTAPAIEVSATLSTNEPLITITEAAKSFGSIGGGAEADNVGIWRDGYHFKVASSIPQKTVRFDLAISTGDGLTFTDSLIISIGTETDQSPPRITVHLPAESTPVPVRRFPIEISFHDGLFGSGIDSSSLRITNDKDIGSNGTHYLAGSDLSSFFKASDSIMAFTIPDSLEFPLGENLITVTVEDKVGNAGETKRTFTTSYFGLLNAADSAYVNTSPFSLTGYAVEKYVGSITVNGAGVTISNDQFQSSVPLVEGANIVEVSAHDHSMNLIGTEQFTLFYDNRPPTLTVASPPNGATLQFSPITVSGSVSDVSPTVVYINGKSVEAKNGRFAEQMEIGEGDFAIDVSAIDAAGNKSEKAIRIFGRPPESPAGRLKLFLKDKVLSKFPFAPYPPNTSGFHMSYIFGSTSWQTTLQDDIKGNEYKVSVLYGCYGLGEAHMQGEFIVRRAGQDSVIATTQIFIGNLAGPTPWPFMPYVAPARKEMTIKGIDPETIQGDTLIFRIKKVGGDRVGLIFIRESSRGHSWITIPAVEEDSLSKAINFTKITQTEIATDEGNTRGASWGDFDGDGNLDLFVANDSEGNNLFQNTGNGTFVKLTASEIANDNGRTSGGSWGDYDNDGDLDLFTTDWGGENNALYRNDGNGVFAKITEGPHVNDGGKSTSASWADYDNDGNLDLFVANDTLNFLYRNEGGGTFTKILTGDIVNDEGSSRSISWGDYDSDGDLDLFVANASSQDNFFYTNNGNGTFRKVTAGPLVSDGARSMSSSWGDYDNDGDLDLFVANYNGENNHLYQNQGNGTFIRVMSGVIVFDGGNSRGSAWSDIDNDGDLDLFVSNYKENNFLYINNGDGAFSKITSGALVSDFGSSRGCSWGDYDNDGDPDLFVANFNNENNFLYRNEGNSNHWIDIRCIGIESNKSAIGAKVRVKATIFGKAFWQLREISGQTGYLSQNSLNAEFGLGDATVIDSIKIEWPSGKVQILKDVAVDQFLTIEEDKPTDVAGNLAGLPDRFALSQNYPNPFNPETTIKYQLPKATEVKLTIYNLLGQRVATLVDKKQPAGYYSINWNGRDETGRDLASGVYFYRLRVKDFVQTRKMVLVR